MIDLYIQWWWWWWWSTPTTTTIINTSFIIIIAILIYNCKKSRGTVIVSDNSVISFDNPTYTGTYNEPSMYTETDTPLVRRNSMGLHLKIVDILIRYLKLDAIYFYTIVRPILFIKNPKNLEHITNIFFNQKRKMINKPLKILFNDVDYIAKKFQIDLNQRPQNLSPLIYCKLCDEYETLN